MAERRVGDRGADGKPAVAGQGAAGLGENAQATASYPETGSGAVFQNATRQHVGTISGNIADPELHVDLVATDRHGTVGLIDRASSGIGRAVVTTHGRAGTRDRGQIERAGAVQVKYRPAGGATHLEADAGSGVTAAASVVDHSRIDDGRSGASVGTAQGQGAGAVFDHSGATRQDGPDGGVRTDRNGGSGAAQADGGATGHGVSPRAGRIEGEFVGDHGARDRDGARCAIVGTEHRFVCRGIAPRAIVEGVIVIPIGANGAAQVPPPSSSGSVPLAA